MPQLVQLLSAPNPAVRFASLNALNELLYENVPNQAAAVRGGVVEPCIALSRSEDEKINASAATILAQVVLSEAAGSGVRAPIALSSDTRLQVLAAMAMSSSSEAHAIATMGLATMCNAPDVNLSLVAQVALPALVRMGKAPKPDTQAAALDALSVLAELPQVMSCGTPCDAITH